MVMRADEVFLHCDEDMSTFSSIDLLDLVQCTHGSPDMPYALSQNSTEHSDHDSASEIDTMREDTQFLDTDHDTMREDTQFLDTDHDMKHEHAVEAACDRQDVLRWMFAQSTTIELHRQPLSPSIVTLRMACVRKMQQILHFSQMNGETVVHEATVIQAILLLDWIIEHEFVAFMHMKPEVLSGVCIILSVDDATDAEMEALFRLVAFTSYTSENDAFLQSIVRIVNRMEAQVMQRYTKLVFTDFIKQYFAHDECTMQRLVHFFYCFTTQDCETWLLNIYKSFVEITLKESTDMRIHVEILDDYLRICV
jgi:hypothetical protein